MPRSRRPIPLARSIRWVPTGLFTPPRTIDDLALFIEQRTLRDVLHHLSSEPGEDLLGFLLGELYDCPETGARYVVMNAALPTEWVIRAGDPEGFPEDVWDGVQREARRRQTRIVGWYHGADFVGAQPDRYDLETHRLHFSEPWQYGLVVAVGEKPAGGFFRPHLGEMAGGGVFTPFHELLDAAPRAGERKRTLIHWTNYMPQEPVERELPSMAAASSAPAAAPPPREENPVVRGEAAEPAGAAGAAGITPLPLVLPSPAELEAMLAAAQPPPRRPRAVLVAAALLVAVGATAAGLYWYRGRIAELPEGAGEFFSQVSTGQVPPTTAPPQLADSASTGRVSMGTSSAGAGVNGTSPASPSPTTHEAALPAPSTNHAVLHFDTLADTLEQAVRNFRDRGTDFSLNRIACDGLAVGYRSADVAFMALASAHRAARDALDSAREGRFQRLAGQMRQVNEEFDSTKCPRP